jgi:oligoendopeptidase F
MKHIFLKPSLYFIYMGCFLLSQNLNGEQMTQRDQLPKEYTWDLDVMYQDDDQWNNDFEKVTNKKNIDQILAYKDKLESSEDVLKNALDDFFNVQRKAAKLYVFATLYKDQDLTSSNASQKSEKIDMFFYDFSTKMSWLEPEILEMNDAVLEKYLKSEKLKDYWFYLSKLKRLKAHSLNHEKQELLSNANKALSCFEKIYDSLYVADMKFPDIEDSDGKLHKLSENEYGKYRISKDRILRKNAYLTLLKKYGDFENTYCSLLLATIRSRIFEKETKKYSSCLEASLYPKNIDCEIYHNLIDQSRKNVHLLKKYHRIRKKALNFDDYHLYDMTIPLVDNLEKKIPIEDAKKIVVESVAILGNEYQSLLKKGIYDERWVDFLPNKGKQIGGYSYKEYETNPYIMMNYNYDFNSLATLAHECGHSMHSKLSHENQVYPKADYSSFLAEIASTFNESLLLDSLMKNAKSSEEKKYYIVNQIDRIIATFFRQALIAEFDLKIHTLVEKNIPLTTKLLKQEYRALYEFYYGNDCINIDKEIEMEWARILHLYRYDFYVFQYATSVCSSIYLFQQMKNSPVLREKYLKFLSSGGSKYPLEILKDVGIDMKKSDIYDVTMKYLQDLLNQLENYYDR